MKRRLSVTNLSSENNLLTFCLNAPVVIRAKVKKCSHWLYTRLRKLLVAWLILVIVVKVKKCLHSFTFALMTTEAFSRNVSKLFSELKLTTLSSEAN